MNNIKCLCIKQPYADLILQGKKIYEIRSWQTSYRGLILITSSKMPIESKYKNLPLGKTICIAELYDIVKFTIKHVKKSYCCLKPNHFAWCLKNIKPIRNYDIKNQLGLFYVPIYLKVAVMRFQEV